jgi:hypothetical protein
MKKWRSLSGLELAPERFSSMLRPKRSSAHTTSTSNAPRCASAIIRSKTSRVFAALAFSSYSATTSRPRVAITRSTSGRWFAVCRSPLLTRR